MRTPPTVLILSRTLRDAREAATNLGLREWATPDDRLGGRRWSGIVYVDGWRQCALPALVLAQAVATATAGAEGGELLELEQHDSGWYFAAESNARNAQAVLANERALRNPATPLSVAPELIDQAAAPVARLPWWRSILRHR